MNRLSSIFVPVLALDSIPKKVLVLVAVGSRQNIRHAGARPADGLSAEGRAGSFIKS
jgi:hypothetical protein